MIPHKISGIPCLIRVDSYQRQKPNALADNPWDYDGYTECEYTICDRNGRPAEWLARKVTPRDEYAIMEAIEKHGH